MRNTNYFNQLMTNIEALYNLRADNKFPFIHVATTITYESNEQVNRFKARTSKISDLVTVGRTKLEHIHVQDIKLSENDREKFQLLKEQQSLIKVRMSCCPEVYDKLSIDWDGKVTACCSDYDNQMTVGNLADNTLKEIWNGNELNSVREILAKKEYHKIEHCKMCYDYMSLQTVNVQKT